jgi:hypothetical protein
VIISEEGHRELIELLLGRVVRRTGADTLQLDDGRSLRLRGLTCPCGVEGFALAQLGGCPEPVTLVELARDVYADGRERARVSVYGSGARFDLAVFTEGKGCCRCVPTYEIEVI